MSKFDEVFEKEGVTVDDVVAFLKARNKEQKQEAKKNVPREQEFKLFSGRENKKPRPGAVYLSTPGIEGSDGKVCRGVYLEVGCIDQTIADLQKARDMLVSGSLTLPEGYAIVDENGRVVAREKK